MKNNRDQWAKKKKSLLFEKINEVNKTLARQMKFFIK